LKKMSFQMAYPAYAPIRGISKTRSGALATPTSQLFLTEDVSTRIRRKSL
jgi:hypothetical protein